MAMIVATCACGTSLHAQSAGSGQSGSKAENPQAMQDRISRLEAEVAELKDMIKQLQPAVVASAESERQTESEPPLEQRSTLQREDRMVLDFLRDTTIDVALDGYYAYNFNHPVGRVNLLRAYDVLSNNFSINQANVIFEHAPDLSAGRRFGARIDLQF